MKNVNAEHYTYHVRWSAEDAAFIGTVAELPSLSWFADEQAAASSGIRALVADVLDNMEAHGERSPLAHKDTVNRQAAPPPA